MFKGTIKGEKKMKEIDELKVGDIIEGCIGGNGYQIHYEGKNRFIIFPIDEEGQLGNSFYATRRGLELLIIQGESK